MKGKILLIFLTFSCSLAMAQYVPVDAAFENELINQNIDSEQIADGRILLSDALATTTLNLSGSIPLVNNPPGLGLTNIDGIEFFANLENLRIEGNNITNLDLTQNTLLRILRAWRNGMETLLVDGLENLETVGLNFNNLSSVDFSTNVALVELDITDNNLTSISIGNKANLNKFTLSNNPNLTALNISGADRNLTIFDALGNNSLNCIEVLNLANANAQTGWQKEISTNYSENCSGQGYTQIPDIAFENYLITQGIDSQGLANGRVLTGDIQNISSLNMVGLGIASLSGISDFSALQNLNVAENSITSVDLSSNLFLQTLSLRNNALNSLNITQNTSVTSLNIAENPGLTQVDLSQNIQLTIFTAFLCNLQTLDISSNINLEELTIYRNNLTTLDVTNNTNLTYINSGFMPLSSIDISQNSLLENLFLTSTGLNSIDFSNNPLLTALLLGSNNLSAIDTSNLPNLNTLYVDNNNLTSLSVRQNPILNIFWAQGNPGLTCIEVNDVVAAQNQFNWRKDGTAIYSDNCSGLAYTPIPDSAFENYLIAEGIDTEATSDGRVLTSDIENVLNLDMPNLGISNLSGIEDFIGLQSLNTDNNNIPSVDLTNNLDLVSVSLRNNGLSTLNVSQNTNLTTLNIAENSNITTIDIRENVQLTTFTAFSCSLETLDLSLNSNLQNLIISNNQLTSINLSQNNNLTSINLSNNALDALDLRNIPVNQLEVVYTCNTGLSCISVSDVNAANSSRVDCPPLPDQFTGFIVDSATTFSLDCDAPDPFQVVANLNNDPNAGNITVTEGDTFTIDFTASGRPTGSTPYSPVITFSLNGAPSENDFIYNGSTTVPNERFAVTFNEANGSVSIQANDDGLQEGDEIYTLSITSPDTSVFVMEEPNVFTVTVADKRENTNESLLISTTLQNLGSGPYYQVSEGDRINLIVDANNNATEGANYSLEVSFSTFTIGPSASDEFNDPNNPFIPNERILQETGDVVFVNAPSNNISDFTIASNAVDGILSFDIIDDIINEETEELIITVKTTNENHTLSNERFIIKIKASDPIVVSVVLEDAGNAPNFNVSEGATFNLIGNILGNSEQTFEFSILDESTDAKDDSDYSYVEKVSFEKTSFDDFTVPFTVFLDSITETQETIRIRLNKPSGNFSWENSDVDTGELSFEIAILDQSFTVSAELTDAVLGNDGIYILEEGLNFNINTSINDLPENIALNGVPFVAKTLTISEETENDIAINGSIPEFLSQNNTISFNTILDGIQEGEEIVEITLTKPLANYTWENENTDGSLTFRVRITDVPFSQNPETYSLNIFADSYDPLTDESTERRLTPENGTYKVNDNETLRLFLSPEGFDNIQKGLRINAVDGTAIFGTDYTSDNLNQNKIYTSTGNFSGVFVNFSTISPNTPNKTFELEFIPTTNNYSFTGPENNTVAYLESFRIPFEIENSGSRPPQEIILDTKGVTENFNDGDAITSTFEVQENQEFVIEMRSRTPNENQGAIYNMRFNVGTALSTMTEGEDYEIRIEDSNGNDMNGSLANYTVNNDAEYDAKIIIEIIEDNITELPEELLFNIVPDVTFDSNNGGVIALRTTLSGVKETDQKQFKLRVSESNASQNIIATLSNTGGTEGSSIPDIITCALSDSDGNPYNATSRIEIPYLFIEDLDEEFALFEEEFNPTPSQRVFIFEPGDSTSSIEVLYSAETDENEIDCDYYSLQLIESQSSLANNILVDTRKYPIKIADSSDFLIFVDLDISDDKTIRPVVRNRHPSDTYESTFGGFVDFLFQEIEFYEVEEGPETQLRFTIDAAQPVSEGTPYILNIDKTGSSARTNSDYSFIGGDKFSTFDLNVLEGRVDRVIEFEIEPDDDSDEETLRLSFEEPKTQKDYRFSKKDSRSYDQSYTIKILEAIPVSVSKGNSDTINEELPSESFGEFIFTIDRSKETQAKDLDVLFSLSESQAEFFVDQPDYAIITANTILFNKENGTGIIKINKEQTEVVLKIVPINDTEVEGTENIRLKIIDDFGYRPSATQGEANLTLTDDDQADFIIEFKNEITTLFESRNSDFSGELIISLDRVNDTGQAIPLDLKIDSSFENSATFNEDYELFLNDASNNSNTPITSIENLNLEIPNNSQEIRLLVVVKEDTDFEETDETIGIFIDTSEAYEVGPNAEQTIIIKNAAADGTSNITLYAEVISSSCPLKSNGRIRITNQSEYTFNAILFQNNSEVQRKVLTPTLGSNKEEDTFQDLSAGSYTVYISYEGNQSLPEDYIPPSFELTIREVTDNLLLNATADLDFKLAKLTVSGSTSYTVFRNNDLFTFEPGNTAPTTLEIPMSYGKNVFEIKGETACQNTLKTTLFFNDIESFPNPTADYVYIGGFFDVEDIRVSISEPSGKSLLINKKIKVTNGVVKLDLNTLSPGVYFVRMEIPNASIVDVKIIKK